MQKAKQLVIIASLAIILALLLPSCAQGPSENAIQTAIVQTQNAVPSNTALPSNTPVPSDTSTPLPTDTPEPTRTPMPTSTKLPTKTSTPTKTLQPTIAPTPIVLSGNGDKVVDLEKFNSDPIILHITYTGSRNFIVQNYGADGKQIDLLVNTIGAYDGKLLTDILDDDETVRFEVKSSGSWTIEVMPLSLEYMQSLVIPGSFEGVGDDLVILAGKEKADLLEIDASQAKKNLIIHGVSRSTYSLLVNEIAPYTGTKILDDGTFLIIVRATGPWKILVTAKK